VIEKVLAHIKQNESSYVERLKEFLRIPSISTTPERKQDVRKAATWVYDTFRGCGIDAEMIETARHPAIIADTGPTDNPGPTILVYGHYDVQPTGDRALWHADPFEPVEVDGALVARGSADDKGQMLTHILAAEAWMKVAGKLPTRYKFVIEGEEEIGSPNLDALVEKHKERLACDFVAISDTSKLDANTPAITIGTKGMIYKQIEIVGPKQDLHSGSFGGTVTNPGNALCQIIASLRDADNRVTIPGFYDNVTLLSAEEREMINSLPFSEADYLESVGSPSLHGETGFTTQERRGVRPTLDVNGLFGGFMAEGAATIIPSKMGAKVSMRIVPNQDPEVISEAFDRTVKAAAPDGVTLTVSTYAKCAAYICPSDLPGLKAARNALKDAFGTEPVMIREGGSLPILPMFKRVLGADSIMLGLAMPNCNLHGPNEFFHKSDFWGGIRTSACFAHRLASGD